MSRWALVGSFLALVLSSSAAAQSVTAAGETTDNEPGVQPEPPMLEVGSTGFPGGDHVGYPELFPKGTVSTAFAAGFGFRSGLLASGHSMSRGSATAALAYSVADVFTVGLMLDGRYDKHSGTGLDDDGWVGEPRLHLRAGTMSGSLAFGGEVTVWTPGKDAPSIVPKATSIELRAMVSTRLGSGLRLAGNLGFRLDNSAKSVEMQEMFSIADQSSLGVSQWNALVAGVRVGYPVGKLVIGVEAELDAYVGSPKGEMADKPSPSLLLGAGISYQLTPNLTAELFLNSNIQEKPTVSVMGTIALIPYGPTFAGGLGLQARFGGPKKPAAGGVDVVRTDCDDPDPGKRPDSCAEKPPEPKLAILTGVITDDTGAPLANATVTITDCDGKSTTATTDDTGRYRATDLKPCEVTVSAAAPGRTTQSVKASLAAGDNTAPTTPLPPVVKPGTFRFVIRSFSTGKGVEADVEITPGGQKVVASADGSTSLEIAPGRYTLRITSAGLKEQTREYVVTENNVVIVNVDLRK